MQMYTLIPDSLSKHINGRPVRLDAANTAITPV
jgi:hypothetical protein